MIDNNKPLEDLGRRIAEYTHHADGIVKLIPGIDADLAARLANLVRLELGGIIDMPPAAHSVARRLVELARERINEDITTERKIDNGN